MGRSTIEWGERFVLHKDAVIDLGASAISAIGAAAFAGNAPLERAFILMHPAHSLLTDGVCTLTLDGYFPTEEGRSALRAVLETLETRLKAIDGNGIPRKTYAEWLGPNQAAPHWTGGSEEFPKHLVEEFAAGMKCLLDGEEHPLVKTYAVGIRRAGEAKLRTMVWLRDNFDA